MAGFEPKRRRQLSAAECISPGRRHCRHRRSPRCSKGRTIRIAGAKSVGYGEKTSIHRRERLAGSFDRAITLPVEIDADKVKAECRDGILALYLARAERDKPRAIQLS